MWGGFISRRNWKTFFCGPELPCEAVGALTGLWFESRGVDGNTGKERCWKQPNVEIMRRNKSEIDRKKEENKRLLLSLKNEGKEGYELRGKSFESKPRKPVWGCRVESRTVSTSTHSIFNPSLCWFPFLPFVSSSFSWSTALSNLALNTTAPSILGAVWDSQFPFAGALHHALLPITTRS